MKRKITSSSQIDLDSPGRRDYFVKFEHPTFWGDFLVPVTVLVGKDAQPGRGVVAIGSTHGNEYEGPVAIKHLARNIKTEDVCGRVILIPVLNVSAFSAGTRDTPEDGANLNRAFPGDANGSITSRFAHFISTKIFPTVHVVLDLHAGGRVARFAHCIGFHVVKDPQQQKAMEQTARNFGAPFVNYYQDETPGLLTSAAEKLGKIAIGGEYGWGQSVNRAGVDMCYQGIVHTMHQQEQWTGTLPEWKGHKPDEQKLIDFSSLSCYINASFEGHFEPTVDCGDKVIIGDRIGWLHDFNRIDDDPEPILAPNDGYVLSQAWEAKVFRGQTISVVGLERDWMK